MSLYEKWSTAMDKGDADSIAECLHEDYKFIRHQSGTTMNKTEMVEMMRGFMASDAVEILSTRCIYENQDLIVEHTVMDFADGTREAVLGSTKLKDGLMYETETGATRIEK